MTSRERVIKALEHQEPDRVPFDCRFTYEAYRKLEKTLGYPEDKTIVPRSPDLGVTPSIEFLKGFNVDLYYIGLNSWKNEPSFYFGAETFQDAWGVGFKKISSDSGTEYFNDSHPLSQATQKDLEKFAWPDPDDPELTAGLQERAAYLSNETDFALVGKFSSSIFEQAAALLGMQQLYVDLAQDPDFVMDLFNRLTDIAIKLNEVGLKACGQYLHILRLAGDDMGSQRGTLLNPKMFRRMVKPFFERLYHQSKALFLKYNPKGKLMAHTDGDVYPIIPDYCEMGLDVLNPVQPYVAEMEHEKLKTEFGDRLSFHGGIDIQNVLPFGSPQVVTREAIKVMKALGRGGGYILSPTHYLLADVPPENILAMRDAVLKSGNYPLSGL